MGAEQSQTTQGKVDVPAVNGQGLQILKKDVWNALGVKDDPRYGEFKLFTTGDGRQIAIVHKTCQDYSEYAALCGKLSKAKDLNTIPGMVKLLEISSHEEGNLCSSFYKVTAVYEYFETVVEHYYQELQGRPCSSEIVMGFLGQMLNTLSELYGLGVIHGDVTPHSILVHRHANNLYFKLNNVQQMTGFNQYKRALLEAEDCRWHLAPELLDSLAKRELRPQYDCQKSDVYSLGLTVLEMGTGKIGLGGLYDLDTITVNESVLEALLERFSSIHGQHVLALLRLMLQEDFHVRPTFSELLKQYALIPAKQPEPRSSQPVQQHHESVRDSNQKLARSNQYPNPPTNRSPSQALSPTHQPIFKRIDASRGQSPQLSASKAAKLTNNENANRSQESVTETWQEEKPKARLQTSQPIFSGVPGLKDQTNTIKPPTPGAGKKVVIPFQVKPQATATTTLRRPKHDQNQFKPVVKKSKPKLGK